MFVNFEAKPGLHYICFLINGTKPVTNFQFPVNGTAGEGVSMTVQERKTMAEKWVAASQGKLKTIVHCGAVCIRDARDLVR